MFENTESTLRAAITVKLALVSLAEIAESKALSSSITRIVLAVYSVCHIILLIRGASDW